MTEQHDISIVKPSDKLIIIAPNRITSNDLDEMNSAISKFQHGDANLLVIPPGSKLCIVDKNAEAELKMTPDNIMLTAEHQWTSELFEELCAIKPKPTPIDASEPVTERHPAVESLISQLSTVLYGDENE